jgi:MoaA/NifB/PqqE/SkfB family radical SAM enzyme
MCGVSSLIRTGEDSPELSREEMLRITGELAEMGTTELILLGGEPFLRPDDVLAVTARAQQLGLKTAIVTNGTLIDENMARGILDSGLRKLIFSIDGVGAAHDRVRGVSGAFERAREGIRLVTQEKRRRAARLPFVMIQGTLSRLNFDQVGPLFRFREEVGADSVHLHYAAEVSAEKADATQLDGEGLCSHRWVPNGESVLLSPKELAAFRDVLERAPKHEDVRILKALNDEAYLKCEHTPRRCYEMRIHMIINPFGEAHPCIYLDRCVTGNVREAGVRAVWQNERHRKVVAGLRNGMYPVCSGCCFIRENLTPWQLARLRLFNRL